MRCVTVGSVTCSVLRTGCGWMGLLRLMLLLPGQPPDVVRGACHFVVCWAPCDAARGGACVVRVHTILWRVGYPVGRLGEPSSAVSGHTYPLTVCCVLAAAELVRWV